MRVRLRCFFFFFTVEAAEDLLAPVDLLEEADGDVDGLEGHEAVEEVAGAEEHEQEDDRGDAHEVLVAKRAEDGLSC